VEDDEPPRGTFRVEDFAVGMHDSELLEECALSALAENTTSGGGPAIPAIYATHDCPSNRILRSLALRFLSATASSWRT
jgi:hypothetical protein